MSKSAAAAIGLVVLSSAWPARAGACRVEPLQTWTTGKVQWLGPCERGAANGFGVLKYYVGAEVKESFYGEAKNGRPVFGVLALDGGYVAGRFENGQPQPADDRDLTIRAFSSAQKAAESAAANFARTGNAASARFYRDAAQRLKNQMD